MPLGKKYKAAIASYDIEAAFSSSDALNKAKTMATAKFDETIELVVRLGQHRLLAMLAQTLWEPTILQPPLKAERWTSTLRFPLQTSCQWWVSWAARLDHVV
jgi:ribosomal protein L1